MNDGTSRFFRGLSIFLALMLLAEAAGGALVVVGLREQEARHAQAALEIKQEMTDAGRKLRSLDAQAEQDKQPGYLRVRVGDRLAAPKPEQIVWVRPVPPAQNRPDLAPLPAFSIKLASLDPASAPVPPR
jgi:hypothetical protein